MALQLRPMGEQLPGLSSSCKDPPHPYPQRELGGPGTGLEKCNMATRNSAYKCEALPTEVRGGRSQGGGASCHSRGDLPTPGDSHPALSRH